MYADSLILTIMINYNYWLQWVDAYNFGIKHIQSKICSIHKPTHLDSLFNFRSRSRIRSEPHFSKTETYVLSVRQRKNNPVSSTLYICDSINPISATFARYRLIKGITKATILDRITPQIYIKKKTEIVLFLKFGKPSINCTE